MNWASIWTTIQDWPVSAAVRGDISGTEWLFPIVETLHVMALAIVFGSIAMVDVRLLGVGNAQPVSQLTREVLPWTWIAWLIAALFGTLMFMSKAATYAGNLQFQLKFLFMACAALNMLVFHFGVFRSVERWDVGPPPARARCAGALSLSLWIGVVFFGRWIGFTT